MARFRRRLSFLPEGFDQLADDIDRGGPTRLRRAADREALAGADSAVIEFGLAAVEETSAVYFEFGAKRVTLSDADGQDCSRLSRGLATTLPTCEGVEQ
jgi:hypothetical protein